MRCRAACRCVDAVCDFCAEKTIHDEETSNVDVAESMADYKVRMKRVHSEFGHHLTSFQSKLEAQFATKRESHANEVQDLKQQLELKANEVRSLGSNINELKNLNEELKVRDGAAVVHVCVTLKMLFGTACFRSDIGGYRRGQEPCGECEGSGAHAQGDHCSAGGV